MHKYSLEILNWGTWELEKDFSSLECAKDHGVENFPQNEWRIFDRVVDNIVYHHDPMEDISREAQFEVRRFQDTEHWRQVFAERDAAHHQREHLIEIASRQRSQEQQRRERLSGYSFNPLNFAGMRPHAVDLMDVFNEYASESHQVEDKVNWLKEGF